MDAKSIKSVASSTSPIWWNFEPKDNITLSDIVEFFKILSICIDDTKYKMLIPSLQKHFRKIG